MGLRLFFLTNFLGAMFIPDSRVVFDQAIRGDLKKNLSSAVQFQHIKISHTAKVKFLECDFKTVLTQ